MTRCFASVYDWLEAKVRGSAAARSASPRRLAPYAGAWEKVTEAAREIEALNLDKRAFRHRPFFEMLPRPPARRRCEA